ncbi:MAG: BrxA/BrxB family bacilliredoxin [Candidatus Eisenbacteria bacterium]|nr:BrxA/BrxB family bacilliredoxin [Candidatus Eisenbacteria bacterium]
MGYDETLVAPMREELAQLGFKETKTAADVQRELESTKGVTMVVVNSVCGCAAGKARPGIALAMQSEVKPENFITVFAGNDVEATAKARGYFTGYLPSSPAIGLVRDGKLLFMMERHDIEGNDAMTIANRLNAAFQEHCVTGASAQ